MVSFRNKVPGNSSRWRIINHTFQVSLGVHRRYVQLPIFMVLLIVLAWQKELPVGNHKYSSFSNPLQRCLFGGALFDYEEQGVVRVQQHCLKMENRGVEELVIQLEQSMDLSIMESGVKMVGKVLTSKVVNKWGVQNIIKAAWKEYGGVEIKWVKDNIFTLSVQDASMASKLLEQTPWAVMKKIFSIQLWPSDLALEEIELAHVPFWVQIRGIPMCFVSLQNIKRLTAEVGEFIALEDPGKARGFLRVRILIDTNKPLLNGCWLRRDQTKETWVEFRFEKLQDFCYRCGRIGHVNTDCTFEETHGGTAGYGEWTKAQPVREIVENVRNPSIGRGEQRKAGMVRSLPSTPASSRGAASSSQIKETFNMPRDKAQMASAVIRGRKKWHRVPRVMMPHEQVLWSENNEEMEAGVIGSKGELHIITRQQLEGREERTSGLEFLEGGLKRGQGLQWEAMNTSPYKKGRGPTSGEASNCNLEGFWREMHTTSNCFMVERTLFAAHENLSEARTNQQRGEKRRELLEVEREDNENMGGGGWPSTAAGQS